VIRIKIIFFVFLFVPSIIFAQQEKYIAVTFDDLPFQHSNQYTSDEQYKFNRQILESVKKYNIPAVGFVNESKLFVDDKLDSTRLDILKLWLDTGLELGNHTFSHPNINQIPFEEYKEDLLKGERITRKLAEERNIKYEYFRHP
jgi:peptidoglycan/xylan/chitin deacetylase (PgdA/CDA1 family)